ncbi:uncharacterized protein LOC111057455 [Nilaparvata lugens]|uniref:uncharacterized protein LOC111057455 n=1 Tax=Nilaparvata lugens TaxID=108931 RepID=UPI00193E368B|nr:uncharacterized protein LOC111057455 [Nilaparvata lugens]XP_039295673.1 uncharacterized protein LOC111057455 [Nilaparvata lugens]
MNNILGLDFLILCSLITFQSAWSYGIFKDSCTFPEDWAGRWFQSGVRTVIINSTSIQYKGNCIQSEGDKFLIEDKEDNCFRCVVIHEKHENVLQYKETYCEWREPLETLCEKITGDAPLFSMFRVEAKPSPCPFKPPFTYTYNRGSGECRLPVSRADPCTEDSRLLLRYQACPDVHNSESSVEELVCLAWWKDGSMRYLVGQLHHHMVKDDEDRYRCFVFEERAGGSFNLAQSGDATCNGLLSPTEGSRTLQLKRVETHHNSGGRVCRFPAWLTTHHLWHTLDYSRSYHFSPRNGTLRVTSPTHVTVLRAQCHHVTHATDTQALLVTHLTTGCQSGYSCMMFYKRESHVIELQQSANRTQTPEEACLSFNFNPLILPYTTLTTSTPRPRKCPYLGRYEVSLNETLYSGPPGLSLLLANPSMALTNRNAASQGGSAPSTPLLPENCKLRQTQTLTVGCSESQDKMEFHTRVYCAGGGQGGAGGQTSTNRWYSTSDGSEEEQAPAIDTLTAYSCHGDWTDHNGTTRYLIVLPSSRKSVGARRYCFVMQDAAQAGGLEGSVHISSLTESCYRHHQQPPPPPSTAYSSQSTAHAHIYHNINNPPSSASSTDQQRGAGEMMMSFNITPLGECSSAVMQRSQLFRVSIIPIVGLAVSRLLILR